MGSNRPRQNPGKPGEVLLTADSRCRMSLFHMGVEAGDLFSARVEDDGTLILTPVVVVPRP